MHEPIDYDHWDEDRLAATGAHEPCPCCGETVGTTPDGPCVACLDADAMAGAA